MFGGVVVVPRTEGITAIGAPRHYYVLGPKPADHPTVGAICLACGQPMREGDYTTMIALGPGRDVYQKVLCMDGKPYKAQGLELHFDCATGSVPDDAEKPRPAPTRDGKQPTVMDGQIVLPDGA